MKLNDQEVAVEINGKLYHCAMDITMDYIGGKWKTVVLWYLRNDKKRFGELRKLIPQITERMLSIQLRQLEEDGLVRREVFTDKPTLVSRYYRFWMRLLNGGVSWVAQLVSWWR